MFRVPRVKTDSAKPIRVTSCASNCAKIGKVASAMSTRTSDSRGYFFSFIVRGLV